MATTNQQIKDLVEDPSRLAKLDPKYRDFIINKIKGALDFESKFKSEIESSTKKFEELKSITTALVNRYDTIHPPIKTPTTSEDIYRLNISSFVEVCEKHIDDECSLDSFIRMIEDLQDVLKIICLMDTGKQLCQFCTIPCKYRIVSDKTDLNDKSKES